MVRNNFLAEWLEKNGKKDKSEIKKIGPMQSNFLKVPTKKLAH